MNRWLCGFVCESCFKDASSKVQTKNIYVCFVTDCMEFFVVSKVLLFTSEEKSKHFLVHFLLSLFDVAVVFVFDVPNHK